MYEDMSPRQEYRGLYDQLAQIMGRFIHKSHEDGEIVDSHARNEALLEDIVSVLRNDHPSFNETRFRQLVRNER